MNFMVLIQVPLVSFYSHSSFTIMNEFYGFVHYCYAGMLPPFAIQSEENRAMARHCSTGIEPRVSAERIILLDTQVLLIPIILN